MVFSSVQMGALITAALLMIIGTVGLVYLDDVIKKIIGASFIGDGVNLLLISLGYKANGITYIFLQNMEAMSLTQNLWKHICQNIMIWLSKKTHCRNY